MKKFLLKPGFELIFSLSLMVILGLPPVLLAQTHKDLDIQIQNGDTTINGKSIKTLSGADRQAALNDIGRIDELARPKRSVTATYNFKDTLSNTGEIRGRKRQDTRVYAFKFRNDDDMAGPRPDKGDMRERRPDGFGPNGRPSRKNTQNFDYVSTDKEGISTRARFRVTEVSSDDLKRMPYIEGGKFEINDLNIVPEFTSGKTILLFNLPAKTVAEVKMSDSEGKLLWTEKCTGGSFNKSFTLGLNGIYYLRIIQGNSIAIKKIIKED
jgi:hypothetical protein